MNARTKSILTAVAGVVIAGGSTLYAQEAAPATEATPDVVVPMATQAKLTPQEMESAAAEKLAGMASERQRVEKLRVEAKASKDLIKLNCVNDKMKRIDELLRIAETSRGSLDVAIAAGNEPERYHRFSILAITGEKVTALADEAQGCVGSEIDYQGPLDIGLDEPVVPDDPTLTDPLDPHGGGDSVIEPPGYASPFS